MSDPDQAHQTHPPPHAAENFSPTTDRLRPSISTQYSVLGLIRQVVAFMTIPKPTQFNLLDGTKIPWLAWGNGTGVERNSQDAVEKGSFAIGCGIRHIDTAQSYQNEKQTGQAIQASGLPKDQIYVTSKLSKAEGSEPIPLEKIG
ncbi:hypothetical protein CVT24_006355 [Panaeolus cyanescens]|uniref:NADP-dependent oxidoreductase domain-containing protein n=1 Tax=Panaeolus cyanescens TaxID=181874 RepID=A0A409YE58_9AGAR|nr:hypothetical protein CVT24_006355 [Panaeolus cyanescens]